MQVTSMQHCKASGAGRKSSFHQVLSEVHTIAPAERREQNWLWEVVAHIWSLPNAKLKSEASFYTSLEMLAYLCFLSINGSAVLT